MKYEYDVGNPRSGKARWGAVSPKTRQVIERAIAAANKRLPAGRRIANPSVFSGGQPGAKKVNGNRVPALGGKYGRGKGSLRHDYGAAGDIHLLDAKGNRYNYNTPAGKEVWNAFMSEAARLGATGLGFGPGYMGWETGHVGFSVVPGQFETWGSAGTSGTLPAGMESLVQGAWKNMAPDAVKWTPQDQALETIKALGYPSVEAFQKAVNLPADGVLGMDTMTEAWNARTNAAGETVMSMAQGMEILSKPTTQVASIPSFSQAAAKKALTTATPAFAEPTPTTRAPQRPAAQSNPMIEAISGGPQEPYALSQRAGLASAAGNTATNQQFANSAAQQAATMAELGRSPIAQQALEANGLSIDDVRSAFSFTRPQNVNVRAEPQVDRMVEAALRANNIDMPAAAMRGPEAMPSMRPAAPAQARITGTPQQEAAAKRGIVAELNARAAAQAMAEANPGAGMRGPEAMPSMREPVRAAAPGLSADPFIERSKPSFSPPATYGANSVFADPTAMRDLPNNPPADPFRNEWSRTTNPTMVASQEARPSLRQTAVASPAPRASGTPMAPSGLDRQAAARAAATAAAQAEQARRARSMAAARAGATQAASAAAQAPSRQTARAVASTANAASQAAAQAAARASTSQTAQRALDNSIGITKAVPGAGRMTPPRDDWQSNTQTGLAKAAAAQSAAVRPLDPPRTISKPQVATPRPTPASVPVPRPNQFVARPGPAVVAPAGPRAPIPRPSPLPTPAQAATTFSAPKRALTAPTTNIFGTYAATQPPAVAVPAVRPQSIPAAQPMALQGAIPATPQVGAMFNPAAAQPAVQQQLAKQPVMDRLFGGMMNALGGGGRGFNSAVAAQNQRVAQNALRSDLVNKNNPLGATYGRTTTGSDGSRVTTGRTSTGTGYTSRDGGRSISVGGRTYEKNKRGTYSQRIG